MRKKGYQLYVERQSSSLSLLEVNKLIRIIFYKIQIFLSHISKNGTGIFHDLYIAMKQQKLNNSYLISSVEEGIGYLMNDSNVAIFGGRETLYFNMKRHQFYKFQLSEKLFTRYSAVAVQAGCPFLDTLNDVIMRLFEANILEKITNQEYEKMFETQKGPSDAKKQPPVTQK